MGLCRTFKIQNYSSSFYTVTTPFSMDELSGAPWTVPLNPPPPLPVVDSINRSVFPRVPKTTDLMNGSSTKAETEREENPLCLWIRWVLQRPEALLNLVLVKHQMPLEEVAFAHLDFRKGWKSEEKSTQNKSKILLVVALVLLYFHVASTGICWHISYRGEELKYTTCEWICSF